MMSSVQLFVTSATMVGALVPALVEAHLFVRLAVGNRPVKHADDVFRLAALVLKRAEKILKQDRSPFSMSASENSVIIKSTQSRRCQSLNRSQPGFYDR
jgi:hypothetical protein